MYKSKSIKGVNLAAIFLLVSLLQIEFPPLEQPGMNKGEFRQSGIARENLHLLKPQVLMDPGKVCWFSKLGKLVSFVYNAFCFLTKWLVQSESRNFFKTMNEDLHLQGPNLPLFSREYCE